MSTKLSAEEVGFVDSARGALTRAEFLRWLIVRERKRRSSLGQGAVVPDVQAALGALPTHGGPPVPGEGVTDTPMT